MNDSVESFRAEWRRSHEHREQFWAEAAAGVDWVRQPGFSLAHEGNSWSWFAGGTLNMSFNALDRHVAAGRGEDSALIFDSAMTGDSYALTYSELLARTSRFAGVLRAQGVGFGDRVIIYMPMIPEAVVAMLACARIGAVHSVVFGGFAANELATRIADAGAEVIVTASGGLEPGKVIDYLPIIDEAIMLSSAPVRSVIVKARPGFPSTVDSRAPAGPAGWLDWDQATATATDVEPVTVASTDPLYVLYTSGTTGNPKGVVRDTGGYAVALSWSMRNIYGIGPGDVFWTASDVGWVVGHSYIVYGPLLAGATTVLYEGKPVGTPDAGAFWRVIDDHRVKVLFTAPTGIRAIRRVDPDLELLRDRDTSTLRALFLAGERLDPETYEWISNGLRIPTIDHWWQTETGWAISANPFGHGLLPLKPGSSTLPMAGYDIAILDGKGRPVPPGKDGNIAIRLPLPPGTLAGVWGQPTKLADAYLSVFPGYYATGDSGYLDEDGYVFVMGRTDDVINVAGHRLSTGALEETLIEHHDVAECAVIGVRDDLKGQRAMGFVTLKAGAITPPSVLSDELVALVRRRIGPVAAFRDVVIVDRLPKTRSGKILRKTLRQIIDGEPYKVPATIEDASVLSPIIALADRQRSMSAHPVLT